jgi:hypothetical protein
MKRVVAAVVAFGVVALLASTLSQAVLAAEASTDRVVAMYFHRTQRCPTCLKMGSYSEEAVKSGLAQQVKDGKVEFRYIDFQDEKNAALTKGYKVGGPTLIVARVAGGKVAEYKNLTEIWTKVRDKEAFVEYVRNNVKSYLK